MYILRRPRKSASRPPRSRKPPNTATRRRILESARELLESEARPDIGLEQVAKHAGVSRQAIYLHFGSRGALLLALVEHVDESEGLAELTGRVRAAPSALEALDLLAWLNAEYEPRIRAVARAHDVARRGDPELEAAWQDRMRARRALYTGVVKRLDDEGRLVEGLTTKEAVDLVWALLGSRVHEDLVVERGWSRRRYEDRVRTLLRKAVTREARPG
jgi:AcrR family transcriptional regulator